MNVFWATYRCEWAKLITRKKYTVFLILGLLLCLLWAIAMQLFTGLIFSARGMQLSLSPTPMGILPFFLQIMIPFLIFMGVSDLITQEGADASMKAALTRPVERWKVYTAKILSIMTYATLYLVFIFFASLVLQLIFGGTANTSVPLSILSYLLTLIPLAILTCFAAFIALLFRSGTLVMFLLILVYLLLSVLPIVFPWLSSMLFTSYLGWYKLWIGALPDASRLINMLLIVLGYGAVFYTAGTLVFDKKDY